jgi:hypothetical protein
MGVPKKSRLAEILARREATDAAHEWANRAALLEHARMGRSVSEWRDGQVVWVAPEEIFARYGLDPNGKPLPPTAP